MSAFRDAVRAYVESELVCPHCKAMNRPGVIYVRFEPDDRAECTVCNRVGPLSDFQPKKEK